MTETWVDSFIPKTLDDIILDSSQKDYFRAQIENNDVRNMTLAGKPGIGKTSLSNIIINAIGAECLELNGSKETGIDTIRNTIDAFGKAKAIDGILKVVLINEADGMTTQAQRSLKDVIERYSDDTRFILTTNELAKIDPALISRCPVLEIKHTIKEVALRMFAFLKEKNIKLENVEEQKNVLNVIKKHYPDIRTTLNILEASCISGKYKEHKETTLSDIEKVVDFILDSDDIHTSRQYWLDNTEKFQNDYRILSRAIFNEVKDAEAMIIVADSLFRQETVYDKEVEFTAMVLKLYLSSKTLQERPL